MSNTTNTTNNARANTERTKNTGNKAQVYNLIIVDESGSMGGLEHATITGVNEIIASLRQAQQDFADTQEHFLTLVTFDSGNKQPVRTLLDKKPISSVNDFKDYSPDGCTPLYDAMGQSISALYKHIKHNNDASAVVTVLTDGLENDSTEWSAQALRRLIEKLKAEGWTFSYMGSNHDVKQVTTLLAIEHSVEFSHDERGTRNTWARERSAKLGFFRQMNEAFSHRHEGSEQDWVARKRAMARGYYAERVTPHMVNSLQPGEVFVFGSNPDGFHNGGAAEIAMRRFGAVWGQSEGLQGQSYAIPTTGSTGAMAMAVSRFVRFAEQHPELRFLVTRVGCGSAGRSVREVAQMFADCIRLENVALPADFWEELGLNM